MPRLLLPRSFLPLAYLDHNGGPEDNHGSRLFSARIEVLEAKHLKDGQAQPLVLIAQSTKDNRLHAVERVQIGIYALCTLGVWVTLRTLQRLPAERKEFDLQHERQNAAQDCRSEREWWRAAVIEAEHGANANLSTSYGAVKTRDVHLCLQRPVQKSAPQGTTAKVEIPVPMEPLQIENTLITMVEEIPQSPEEVLEMIKSQYLEALYASKVGLSYRIRLDGIANSSQDVLGVLRKRTSFSSSSYLYCL